MTHRNALISRVANHLLINGVTNPQTDIIISTANKLSGEAMDVSPSHLAYPGQRQYFNDKIRDNGTGRAGVLFCNAVRDDIFIILTSPVLLRDVCEKMTSAQLIRLATHGGIHWGMSVELFYKGISMGVFPAVEQGVPHPEYYGLFINVQGWTELPLKQFPDKDQHKFQWTAQKPRDWVDVMSLLNTDDVDKAERDVIDYQHSIRFLPMNDIILLNQHGVPIGYYMQDFEGKAWAIVEKYEKQGYAPIGYSTPKSTVIFREDRDKPECTVWGYPFDFINTRVSWDDNNGKNDGLAYSIVRDLYCDGVWDGHAHFSIVDIEELDSLRKSAPANYKEKFWVFESSSGKMILRPRRFSFQQKHATKADCEHIEMMLLEQSRLPGNKHLSFNANPAYIKHLLEAGLVTLDNLALVSTTEHTVNIHLNILTPDEASLDKLRQEFQDISSAIVAIQCGFHATKVSTYTIQQFIQTWDELLAWERVFDKQTMMLREIWKLLRNEPDAVKSMVQEATRTATMSKPEDLELNTPFEERIFNLYGGQKIDIENTDVELEIASVASWDIAKRYGFDKRAILGKTDQIIDRAIRETIEKCGSPFHKAHFGGMKANERLYLVKAVRNRAVTRGVKDERPEYLDKKPE